MIMIETLEETAEKLYQYKSENPPYTIITPKAKIEGFIAGAKWQQEQEKITTDDAYNEGFENGKHWQQERSYSEEEVWKLVNKLNQTLNIGSDLTLEEWFEQFKKK